MHTKAMVLTQQLVFINSSRFEYERIIVVDILRENQ